MRWRDLVFHNLWLKIISLLLATLVWMAARTQIEGNRPVPTAFAASDVPRGFTNLTVLVLASPADPRVFQVEPGSVSVRVGGPAVLLNQLLDTEIGVFVRTPHGAAESVPVQVTVPKGINVMQVRPEAVLVIVKPAQTNGARTEEIRK
jgi:hypothetical protein